MFLLLMEVPLLNDIVVIFVLSIAIFFICYRLRLPAIVGFLITGMLAGPHGFKLVGAVHQVEILAEIGVVLLLFTIGIEFSLGELLKIKKAVLLGGTLQVLLTIFATFALAKQLGRPTGEAIFLGFLISLSSTAIVLKLLQERLEVDSSHGRTCLAILIFQDIAVVPMILLTPFLAGQGGDLTKSLLILALKIAGILLFVAISAKWIVPIVLHQIVRTRSRELFLMSIVAMCFAVALFTSYIGLSLALGAFLAGLIISESEYSHQAFGNILPFKDIFTSFFFVSIGMLLDARLLLAQPVKIAVIVLVIILLKTIVAAIAVAALGFPLRTMLLAGLALSQIAEFSFILSKAGTQTGLMSDETYQLFLAVSVMTMIISPLIISLSPQIADFVLTLPIPDKLKRGFINPNQTEIAQKDHLKDHLIIIGFGINGKNVARAAKAAGITYFAIETNADTVKSAKKEGIPIYYGDAIQESVLEHAAIKDARVMVIAISDPIATRKITAIARQLSPKLHIIARTRFVQEMKPLYDLGAEEVIPEEFETSVEIFTRVLTKYLIPREEIEKFINEVRCDGYEMFRSLSSSSANISDLKTHLTDIEISTFKPTENSLLINNTLAKIKLRKNYGVSVLAIRRDGKHISNPDADTQILANDTLIVLGEPENITKVINLRKTPTDILIKN